MMVYGQAEATENRAILGWEMGGFAEMTGNKKPLRQRRGETLNSIFPSPRRTSAEFTEDEVSGQVSWLTAVSRNTFPGSTAQWLRFR